MHSPLKITLFFLVFIVDLITGVTLALFLSLLILFLQSFSFLTLFIEVVSLKIMNIFNLNILILTEYSLLLPVIVFLTNVYFTFVMNHNMIQQIFMIRVNVITYLTHENIFSTQ